jgi:hypothetical protein
VLALLKRRPVRTLDVTVQANLGVKVNSVRIQTRSICVAFHPFQLFFYELCGKNAITKVRHDFRIKAFWVWLVNSELSHPLKRVADRV